MLARLGATVPRGAAPPGFLIQLFAVTVAIGSRRSAPPVDRSRQLPTIRRGTEGEAVRHAQDLLLIVSDGIFGRRTDLATRGFQRRVGLMPDGIIGPKTWAALSERK
ncbi:peptidoglycan-binding domain-containing protein [Paracoccus sp. PARArs4]|uniref:peptidoglycan-binding domain-containing protein n=1 Tax=Paracoccus sp. PARArs4 TaxID=2853442 RepID=UPI0024A77250|nr:peptidoglycan-binding domain-containing protein [Paracoccus sp. PARArs4]